MANEIRADYDSEFTLYAVVRDSEGKVWNAGQGAFEDWGSDSRNADDYDIPLTDKGGSLYTGNFDSDIPAGRYVVQVFAQSGVDPVDTDDLIDSREMVWSGVAEVTATKIVSNKAVHDKVNGLINYYDDDGTTIMLTHMIHDETSTLTRDPN